jgi:serine/threonine protein kinase
MEITTATPTSTLSVDDLNPLPVGTRLQEFVIERLLGIGGFGIVYEAHDTQLNRRVAIKEYMPTSMAARVDGATVSLRSQAKSRDFDSGKASFINEARMLARFRHPALIEVLRFWEQNSTAYMAMPFYQGSTLKDHLRAKGAVLPSEQELRALLMPILDGLEHMHAEQVYHRDISPDNMMILDDGRSILLDLGAARRLEAQSNQAVTMLVKPGYAPIEQYAVDTVIEQGPWTDIYGWGATAYFALTGKPPPPSASRIMSDSIRYLVELKPAGYSQQFLEAVDAALAVRPDDRPQSIAALKILLGEDAQSSQVAVVPVTAAPMQTALVETIAPIASVETNTVSKSKRRLGLTALAAAMCASVVAGAWWGTRSSPPAATAVAPTQAVAAVAPPVAVPAPAVVSAPEPTAVPASAAPTTEIAPAKPALAKLSIKPWGEVFVNGESRGVSPPLKSLSLPAGDYRIEIRNGDYPVHTENLSLKSGQALSITHAFVDAPSTSK